MTKQKTVARGQEVMKLAMACVVQINVNHSGPAQDLAVQVMRETGAAVMALAEP